MFFVDNTIDMLNIDLKCEKGSIRFGVMYTSRGSGGELKQDIPWLGAVRGESLTSNDVICGKYYRLLKNKKNVWDAERIFNNQYKQKVK